MRKHIEDMGEDEFEKNKSSLVDKILEKPKKLSSRNAKFW
jgi:secreted Zn-dependent insulinase-like peptidase